MFDGPIDPSWVDNLKTVLDECHTLFLPNGERLKINTDIKLIFETENLDFVSPSIISRCGVLWVEKETYEY